MKRIIILTGNELRHKYFRTILSHDERFEVLVSYCEGTERSLEARTNENANSSILEKQHISARAQSEQDFFGEIVEKIDGKSNQKLIKKGDINSKLIVDTIIKSKPDVLVCYGSSLIKSELLAQFEGRFLNVHLGLSPYYRGSGTNVWPLINGEPEMVGATFMYIDPGIDTGKIIHQIKAEILLGDSPHSIGNRLIAKMTRIYCDIISEFGRLSDERQPSADGKLYKMKDFDAVACQKLYDNFSNGMIGQYLNRNEHSSQLPYIVNNTALRNM